jgi:antirestriction protein ArdC
MKTDLYQKVTDQIVASLEQGVRPWSKPWSAEHAAGRITRPLRANGIAYQSINVLVLWSEAVLKGYSAPIWMTFRQAVELGACVRKGEHGSMVVLCQHHHPHRPRWRAEHKRQKRSLS